MLCRAIKGTLKEISRTLIFFFNLASLYVYNSKRLCNSFPNIIYLKKEVLMAKSVAKKKKETQKEKASFCHKANFTNFKGISIRFIIKT